MSLKLGGEIYESSGETVADALVALPRPEKILGKGVLTIKSGKKTKEMLMFPRRLNRLFQKESLQRIQAKWLSMDL